MSESHIATRAEQERQRIMDILEDADISPRRMKMLAPIIENVSWMRAKLEDARELIKNSNVAIPYDNGGGQKGIRENPAFKGYEALWKSYLGGMAKILESLPTEQIQEATDEARPQTVLDAIRAKHL